MVLDELYHQVSKAILTLDFKSIWPGFKPLRFALFNDEMCFFDGSYMEKTDDFCANTAIIYQGEPIAIWKIEDDLSVSVLTSKIVHEMFHGYQTQHGWDCWANEMEALCRYTYSAENLSLKLRENNLLLSLLDRFDNVAYQELLSHRKLRSEKYPYEYSYESKVEEIEGTAAYVEWMVLKQLDKQEAAKLEDRMRTAIAKPEHLLPVRISSYYAGALIINVFVQAGDCPFASAEHPAVNSILKGIQPSDGSFPGKENCDRAALDAIAAFYEKSEAIVHAALEKNEVVIKGPLELVSVNIYDARFYKGYITSRFFLMYQEEGEDRTIYGNFVVKMADEKTISTVYRWDDPSSL